MLVHRTFRNEEFIGDLLIRESPADGHQDLPLARRELIVGQFVVLAGVHPPGERREQPRREVTAAAHDRRNRLEHVADVGVLQQKAPRPGLDHARIVALLTEHRQRDDPQIGTTRQSPLGGLGAVEPRHREVHENDVRRKGLLLQEREELLAARGFAHDAESLVAFE